MSAWSGLGITAAQPYGSWFEFNDSTHAAISAPFLPTITKFPRLRMIVDRSSASSRTAVRLWAQDVKGYSPSTYILYGIANNGGTAVYLPNFYATYLPIMMTEAQWAQDNFMDAFQVANEFEIGPESGVISVTSLSRTSNVVTVVTAVPHNLQTGDDISLQGATPSNLNGFNVIVTVVNSTTVTYSSVAADAVGTGTILMKAGERTIVRFVKLLATQARTVFTRGPITYSVSQGHQQFWTSISPGVDLDLIGLDMYGTNVGRDSFADFCAAVKAMFAIFGTQMFLSEFNLHANWAQSLARGMDPTIVGFDLAYADEAYRRMKFAQDLGLPMAFFFASWNASAASNNEFTSWYNTNTITGNGGAVLGDWKAIYDRLLGQRIAHVFLGTQQHT